MRLERHYVYPTCSPTRAGLLTGRNASRFGVKGPIADRTCEHLGEGDRGIIMFRKLLREQISALQNGDNLIGVNFDPAQDEMIQLIHAGYDAYSFAAAREREAKLA